MRPLIIEPGTVRGYILFTRSHCDCPCGEDGHPSVADYYQLRSALDYVQKYGEPARVDHELLDESDIDYLIIALHQQDAALDERRAANGFRIKAGDR